MRKIYSIVLTACAMLVSASVFAVDVTSYQQLSNAIVGASGEQTVDILLKNSITLDATITIENGQTVNLNLGGFNLTAGQPMVFVLKKGTLNITGTGTIDKNNYTVSSKGKVSNTDAIRVYGSIVSTDANYSNLTIGENVTVLSHGEKKDGKEITNAITIIEQGTNPAEKMAAYGVNIHIKGTVHGTKYGIKLNGNINKETGEIPYVKVWPSAHVYSAPSTSNAIAIYSSGYGKFDIMGNVHGATGVCIKGGIVNLIDAIVKSDYTIPYQDPDARRKANGTAIASGIEAGGSAIVIASQSPYPGHQEVTISGDTKVIGGSGYAIDEALLANSNTKVESVNITGGTIEAGKEGAIIITEETSNENNKVQIVGGNIQNEVYIREEGGTDVTSAPVDKFTPTTGNYNTTAVTDPETGKTTIVVTKLEDGVTIDKTGMTIANAAAVVPAQGLKWTGDNEDIEANITLPYLEINADKPQLVTVKDGFTLTIGRVVMGTKAQIVVEAGAKLIVDGKQGIVATSNNNLVFQTKEGTTAQFLFNPAVTSNRHPNATVEFESKSYYENAEDYRNQRFGIPTMGQIDEITSSNNIPVAFAGYFNGKWQNLGRINATPAIDLTTALNKPFAYYQMSCNIKKDQAHPTITMKGALVGNESPVLTTTEATYTTFANSYMAKLDLKPLYDAIDATDGVEKTLWTYRPVASNTFVWKNYNKTVIAFEDRALEPMQAFYVKNNGNVADIALDYATMIWDARNKEFEALEAAPARRAAANNYDVMAQLTIAANGEEIDDIYMLQGVQFSAEFEDGWDSEKGQNEDVNLFISNNGRMGTLATNDMENTYLGFACQTAGTYTLRFTRMSGDNMVLVDLVNGQRIDMVEGAEYTFDAAADTENDYRFQIVGRRNAATALENTEAAAKAEGIYTLTGMYLGNMSVWNTLPAGIYVVNGEKMVK